MTVKQLADELAKYVALGHSDDAVLIWLPGSLIDLSSIMGASIQKDAILIEGNLREGSALSS